MNCEHRKTIVKGALMALLAVSVTAGSSLSAELAAVPGEWLPPGGVPGQDEIPMWGYVDAGPDASIYTCPAAPVAWEVGPVVAVPAGPLTINLKNCLTEDVSVYIPGQPRILSPQLTTDARGRERLTSFDATVSQGSTGSYTWPAAREGTYLYYSGTNVRTQVPMGLYGALVVSGTGYPSYTQDEVLVFSEIDPLLNADPVVFTGARASNWVPQHFLINGRAYPETTDIDLNVSEDVLLRFVNAGLQSFAPTLEGGLYMDVIGEDGNLYPYPLTQYGLDLPPGKTMDAIVNVGSTGSYGLYDRSLHQSNGGMITFLQATPGVGAPTAADDSYTVAEDTLLTADGNPNPEGVLFNDTPGGGSGTLEAILQSGVSSGTLNLAADGTFTYDPNNDFNGSDSFTYVANEGGPDSNVATVTITVTAANDGPTAVQDSYEVVEGETLVVAAPGILENDTDPDGDTLTVGTVGTPDFGSVSVDPDGGFSFDATGLTGGQVATFAYEACDPQALCSIADVTITVAAAPDNIPPVAVDDTASTPKNTPLVNYNIVANDSDADGTIDATSVVITTGSTTQRGGTVVNNGDGTITFTPKNAGFRGTDTFQYTVNDNEGATSNPATVRINVLK